MVNLGYMRTVKIASTTLLALILVALALCYVFLKSEGLSARKKPSDLEYAIANYALAVSVPAATKNATNPFEATSEALIAAKKDYSDHCAVCHANNGAGNTETAKGLSPEVPDLHAEHIQRLTNGELFYVIRNGVRFTGMPGWNFQDERIWRLVLLIRQFGGKEQSLQHPPRSEQRTQPK